MISEIVLEEDLDNKDGNKGFLHNRNHEKGLQMGKHAVYSKKKEVLWFGWKMKNMGHIGIDEELPK